MPQTLTPEDLDREVRTVFALIDAGEKRDFCDAHKGLMYCDRYDGHNGKHAAGTRIEMKPTGHWGCTKVVRW